MTGAPNGRQSSTSLRVAVPNKGSLSDSARDILNKPGRPSEAEWKVVACHPEHGEEVMHEEPEVLID